MDNQNKLTKRQKYWLSSTWIKCEMPRCDTPFAELFTRQCTTSSSSRAITEMHCYGWWTAKGHYITQLSPLAATCQMAVFSCQFFCFPAYSFFRKKLELRQCSDLSQPHKFRLFFILLLMSPFMLFVVVVCWHCLGCIKSNKTMSSTSDRHCPPIH